MTQPVNCNNINQLINGNKMFSIQLTGHWKIKQDYRNTTLTNCNSIETLTKNFYTFHVAI